MYIGILGEKLKAFENEALKEEAPIRYTERFAPLKLQ